VVRTTAPRGGNGCWTPRARPGQGETVHGGGQFGVQTACLKHRLLLMRVCMEPQQQVNVHVTAAEFTTMCTSLAVPTPLQAWGYTPAAIKARGQMIMAQCRDEAPVESQARGSRGGVAGGRTATNGMAPLVLERRVSFRTSRSFMRV